MRVPGFLHQKGEPFLSRVLHVRSGHPNSVGADNLERALTRTRKKFKVEAPAAKAAVVPPIAALPREILRGIQGIRDCVAGADEGTRNDLLYWGACRYKEKEAEGWITQRYAEEMLLEAAREAGLPDPEASRTFPQRVGCSMTRRPRKPIDSAADFNEAMKAAAGVITIDDFVAYREHHNFIFRPNSGPVARRQRRCGAPPYSATVG